VWSLRCQLHHIAKANGQAVKIVPFLMRRGRTFPPRLPGFPRPEDLETGVLPLACDDDHTMRL
jgi:hypothetical protein